MALLKQKKCGQNRFVGEAEWHKGWSCSRNIQTVFKAAACSWNWIKRATMTQSLRQRELQQQQVPQ